MPKVARLILRTFSEVARRSPRLSIASFQWDLPDSDRAVFRDLVARAGDQRAITAMFSEAILRSARGVVDDYATIARPWGFDVEEIGRHVYVWQGDADTTVPPAHSLALVERLSDVTYEVWRGEGHLGLLNHVDDVLDVFAR
jgi:pimeloyl-ACP methyl ester carboxylesterase